MEPRDERNDAMRYEVEFDESGNPVVRSGEKPEPREPVYRDDISYTRKGKRQ